MSVLESINLAAYQISIGRDTIELGDKTAASVKGWMKYLRNRGTYFRLSKAGTPSALATIDVPNGKIRIPYGTETIEITAHEPDAEFPDGRAEFNVILNSKPTPDVNNEVWQTLDFEVSGFDMERLLGLDEEYDQAKCIEDWGEDYGTGTYIISPTQITAPDGITVLKTKAEHIVHSLKGRAIQNNHDTSVMGKHPENGQDITYTRVSRDHLHLLRRELVDNNGKKEWIEDIQIVGNQIKFKLPAQFLKTAKYPVQHSTGIDPAYTQDWDNWALTTPDGSWVDYDLYTNKGVPKGAVAEIIMANIQAGTENTTGVREDGSAFGTRYILIHEAEPSGETHIRMFVTCHPTTGLIEVYGADISDAVFYLAGYWENVTFTECSHIHYADSANAWDNELMVDAGTDVTNKVCHIGLANTETDVAHTMGVRATGSSLERKLLVHEPESGGRTLLDMFVKADGSKTIDLYSSDAATRIFYLWGYFGSEMDFVELWQQIVLTTTTWEAEDLTAYLDQDGRVVDFLLVHSAEAATLYLGVRDGDDAVTERKLLEHEAESAGAGGEYTGFGLSVKSNASGVVNLISSNAGEMFMLTGYFKPAGGAAAVQPPGNPRDYAITF